MILLPTDNILKLMIAQIAITPVIGNAVLLFRILTKAEVIVPTPICIAPSNAEAVPAFLLKGARDNAEEFGKVKPWQQRKIKLKKIVLNKSITPNKVPANKMVPVNDWHNKAIRIICSLVYIRKKTLFNWLDVISPIAIRANIQPYCFSVTW